MISVPVGEGGSPEHELLWLDDVPPDGGIACRCGLLIPGATQSERIYWWHAHSDRVKAHPEHHARLISISSALVPLPPEKCAMENMAEQDEPCPVAIHRVTWRYADGRTEPRWVCGNCDIWVGSDDE